MQKNSFSMVGIGNAIVDVVVKISEEFLLETGFAKGSMCLISADECEVLLNKIADFGEKPAIYSGGSVANSVFYFNKFSLKSAFIGNISEEDFGKKFADDFAKEQVSFFNLHVGSDEKSAKSIILVTPDGERTMCTYLGCAGKLPLQEISDSQLANSQYILLESYLLDNAFTADEITAFIKRDALQDSQFILSLSDSGCVQRNLEKINYLVKERVDVLVGNMREFAALIGLTEIREEDLGKLKPIFANRLKKMLITCSENGAFLVTESQIKKLPTLPLKALDSTGAGDSFAGGYLAAMIQGKTEEEAVKIGHHIASQVIMQLGARMEVQLT